MKKIIEAYIPFLIYSIIIFMFYFFQQYYFPKYSLVLALLSAPIYVLYLLIGTFVFSYFLGKTVQKRLSNSNLGICIILAIISSLIVWALGGVREIFNELRFGIHFSTFLRGLDHPDTKISVCETFIGFFVGELVGYAKK